MQPGLVRTYKEFSKINGKKNNLTRKWAKDENKYFFTEAIPITNNHMRLFRLWKCKLKP